jgi:thioredoxin reductase
MAKSPQHRIAILGAGPIGLEAALYAATLKFPFTVYERGAVGDHLRRWGHVRLFTPFGMNVTGLGKALVQESSPRRDFPADQDVLTGREHLAAYLEPLANSPLLKDHIRSDTRVLQVGRRGLLKEEGTGDPKRALQPFRLLIAAGGKEQFEEADVVLDCTGVYGQPRWLGDGGIPAIGEQSARQFIPSGLEDVTGDKRATYADKTTLVIGGGPCAASTVCSVASLADNHPNTWVIWLGRGSGSQPLRRWMNDPLKERDALAARANALATRADGAVEYHPQTTIDGIESSGPEAGFKVRARCAGQIRTWEADRLIANVGYSPDITLFRELQVNTCPITLASFGLAPHLLKHASADTLALPPIPPAALRNPEPNFFVLGAKSFGRLSPFFLRIGFDQVRDVFAILMEKGDLDRYKKKR